MYWGVNPHWLAVFTIKITLPLNVENSSSSPVESLALSLKKSDIVFFMKRDNFLFKTIF
tara:strand:+ start:198 stop:374 length:177 start_codon:yes stop_codon:yes gene_type:complete